MNDQDTFYAYNVPFTSKIANEFEIVGQSKTTTTEYRFFTSERVRISVTKEQLRDHWQRKREEIHDEPNILKMMALTLYCAPPLTLLMVFLFGLIISFFDAPPVSEIFPNVVWWEGLLYFYMATVLILFPIVRWFVLSSHKEWLSRNFDDFIESAEYGYWHDQQYGSRSGKGSFIIVKESLWDSWEASTRKDPYGESHRRWLGYRSGYV